VAAAIGSVLLGTIPVGNTTAHGWLYDELLAKYIVDPRVASLAYAVATVAFWWLVVWAMARRGWTVRV
jgi:predicted acyltransferase